MNIDELRVMVVLRRVAEGMSTEADAKFLCKLLGLEPEKVVPNPVKQPFSKKVAS